MTANERITLNIVATYGRSLLSLFCGLLAGRWALMVLGQVDFGLYGLVGGMIGFLTFFNTILACAVSRFYAFSVGESMITADPKRGLEECRSWFSTALIIHFVIAIVLVCVGAPIGSWAIAHWLTIPAERIEICQAIFHVVCVSSFFSMVSVPFTAMYTAKQQIAEQTVYLMIATITRVLVLAFMVSHPKDWLLGYAIAMAILEIVPLLTLSVRACFTFPECKLPGGKLWDMRRMRQLGVYAAGELMSSGGALLRTNGIAVLVNKFLGPIYNATQSVASQVADQTNSLSASLTGAFTPAITNLYGAKQLDKVRNMALRASRFGTALVLLFVIPLSLELPYVLQLWLSNPPPKTDTLCLYILAWIVMDRAVEGFATAVRASGKVLAFQTFVGLGNLLVFVLTMFALLAGWGIHSVGIGLLTGYAMGCAAKLYFAHRIVKLDYRQMLWQNMHSVLLAALASWLLGICFRLMLPAGFLRLALITAVCTLSFLALFYRLVLTPAERLLTLNYLRYRLKRLNNN